MQPTGLVYTDDTHEYRYNGAWRPGATRVLADMGYVNGAAYFTAASRIRGKQVHRATHLVDLHAPDALTIGDALEVIDLGESIQPCVAGWLKWKQETGFSPIGHETPMYLPDLGVAGTPDVWGYLRDGRLALVDLKSWKSQGPKPKRASELQTAGYALMIEAELKLKVDIRIVMKLPGDGTFREYQCNNHLDAGLFRACCWVWNDRAANKLIDGLRGPSEVDGE